MVNGVYQAFPELFVPHSTGETYEKWQVDAIRDLFLGEKKRVTVRAGHGSGKCSYINDLIRLSDGTTSTFGELIGKTFSVISIENGCYIRESRAFAEDNGVENVWKITTASGKCLTRTGNHGLWVVHGAAREWCRVEHLAVGDFICTVNDFSLCREDIGEKVQSHHLGWEKISAIDDMGPLPTVAVCVPDTNTYLTEFYEHNTYLSSRCAYTFFMNYQPSLVVCTGPCVEENERILLADGRWEKVKDLNGRYFGVLAVENDLGFTQALAHAFPNGIKPVFKITTRSGREAIRTGNHPFRTIDGWVPLTSLQVGQFVAVPINLPAYGQRTIGEDEVKFIAYMVSEGCTSKLDSGHITFTQNKGPVLDEMQEVVMRLGGTMKSYNGRTYDIIGSQPTAGGRSRNPLKDICRNHNLDGLRSWEKEIPPVIFELTNDLIRVFLSRLFAGDGYIRMGRGKELGYASTSRALIDGVNRLCLRLGIAGRLRCRKKEKIQPGSKSRRDMYFWYASGCVAEQFASVVGIFGKDEQLKRLVSRKNRGQQNLLFDLMPPQLTNEAIFLLSQREIDKHSVKIWKTSKSIHRVKLQEIGRRTGSEKFLNITNDNIAWDEIVSIDYVGDRMTYGIEVDKHHTYVTDFLEHNTGKQTRNQFWSELITVCEKSVFADDIECLKTRIFIKGIKEMEEKWKMIWVTSKDPKTIEGFHGSLEGKNLLWMIEEAKAVADPVFEALSGALSHKDNFLYLSSTCGPPRGHFFDSHTRLRHLYHAHHIPSTLSSRVSPEQIQIWKDQWGEDSPVFRARVMAEFPEEDESAIASLTWLLRAVENPEEDNLAA